TRYARVDHGLRRRLPRREAQRRLGQLCALLLVALHRQGQRVPGIVGQLREGVVRELGGLSAVALGGCALSLLEGDEAEGADRRERERQGAERQLHTPPARALTAPLETDARFEELGFDGRIAQLP